MKKILDMIKRALYYNSVVKKISGKSHFFDIFLSRIIIGVPFDRYVDFCFYDKPWKVRREYLFNEWKYYVKYNPGVTRGNHDDKSDIFSKCLPYLKREVLKTHNLSLDAFKVFVQGKKSFFYKPLDGDSGRGVEKILVTGDIDTLYTEVLKKGVGILEETVIQHKDMNRMNPNLVQTIRFFVCKGSAQTKIVFTALRTSLKDNVCVDNAGFGGAFANVDLNTGMISTNAFSEIAALKGDFDVRLVNDAGLVKHPVTGTIFKGFKIPFFDEASAFVLEISNKVDFYGRALLGFDIAISEKGPILIEVNANRPGISELWQIPLKYKPLRNEFEKILKDSGL
ncbi:hypothetical protein B7982_10620 [Fibrobacter sp. UWB2]|uniref:sugar-transfer associated ATP-grasp domain-containing protein n=1 Tax=Fibrobacter sp. UWB2 TaxID=1964358 RepID=UPI000B5220CF|nr:sugar-transfer associated ATP-grasp domain-containing protein [Fibrobacter sp. UWB2]OWV21558.1 hypothetical protein B7982_10620 [Fibrobacter sp. UWB2]